MSYKCESWDELDQEFIPRDNVLRFTAEQLGVNKPLDRFKVLVPRYFILVRGDKEYAVNTEGFSYARYMQRIK